MLKTRSLFGIRIPQKSSRSSQLWRHFLVLNLTVFFSAISISTALPASRNGLVGDWNFDERVGATAADSSGNNNTGVLINGPVWTAGEVGAGLSFDGIDDYVEVAHSDSLNLARELTVSAWIYNKATHEPSLQQSEYHVVAAKGWAADVGGSWTLAWDRKTNSLFFCVRKNTDNGVKCASFDFGSVTDDWHLITAVFNDGRMRLYVDGILAAGPVNLGTARINNNTENVHIGGLPSSGGNSNDSWHGFIDQVQLSNVALSPTEVATISGISGSNQNFDFSLTRPGDLSVGQASTAAASINSALLSGTPKFVSFSVSGLPRNVNGSFSATSCSPSCSTILTIKADSNSRTGTYSITVTARGGRVQRRTSFNLSILQPTVPTVATPIITPGGGSFTGAVSISLQDTTSGASIYYTTDGSTPSRSSTPYTGAMTLRNSAVVKAKAFKSGYNPSGEASASFTVNQTFDFSLANSGNKSVVAGSSVTNAISATLVSGNRQPLTFSASGLPSGATASFSPNSCSPSCSSTLTISTSGSTPAGTSTVTVTASGGGVNKTTTFSLTVSLLTVATPTIAPNGGTYTGSVLVTLQTSTAGASIYYTTNGSTPTQSSSLYTGPMTLTNSATIKTKAFKNGYNASSEASATFTITQQRSIVPQPSQVNLTWHDNSTNENGFQIERKISVGGSYAQIASVGVNINSYLNTGLASGTTYCYRVRATNSYGVSAYSNETCVTVP